MEWLWFFVNLMVNTPIVAQEYNYNSSSQPLFKPIKKSTFNRLILTNKILSIGIFPWVVKGNFLKYFGWIVSRDLIVTQQKQQAIERIILPLLIIYMLMMGLTIKKSGILWIRTFLILDGIFFINMIYFCPKQWIFFITALGLNGAGFMQLMEIKAPLKKKIITMDVAPEFPLIWL
jgi:hypothetical protein